MAMFRFFERSLKPTSVAGSTEPPAGLVAFYWHFARQAKPLFIGLFAIGFAVALLDIARSMSTTAGHRTRTDLARVEDRPAILITHG